MNQQQTTITTDFEKEVYDGLTSKPKFLSSKYFYDKKGDALFQKIMELPEYYLTGCEYEILSEHREEIVRLFSTKDGFDLIELGAGDGKKTKVILEELMRTKSDFIYKPIDISLNVLQELEASVKNTWPELAISIREGTYFRELERMSEYSSRKKVILVLGSNIGNLPHPKAIDFLRNIQNSMSGEDLLFMGLDQKKDPATILSAYNDRSGVTEAFNKNLLYRINGTLDADFDPDKFLHWPVYDPETGTTKSFLVSKIKQQVKIKALDLLVDFEEWESIHTEISQKYDDGIVNWLADQAGLQVIEQYSDEKRYFTDYVFQKK